MTLRRPEATLSFDGSRLSAAEAALTELRVELGMGGAHDRFAAAVLRGSAAIVALGATAEIGLGYQDAVETVLTGEVTAIVREPWGAVIEGLAATITLSRARVGRSYVGQTVASIADDLVSSGQASTAEVAAPLELSAYHVDEQRSVWSHLRDLARLAGCELTADASGGLNVRPPKSGLADHTVRGGAEVVNWVAGPRRIGDAEIGVVPYGAASDQGSDKWHLLLKEPDGSGGSDAPALVPAALRAREGAQGLADALSGARSRRATRGVLIVLGDPAIRAGDLVELTEMPAGEDAMLRATSVTHVLRGDSGYLTVVSGEAA
jgi:phage protein D